MESQLKLILFNTIQTVQLTSLVVYADGEKRYIIAPKGLQVGQVIENGEEADIKTGNALPLANIPVGTTIHNIELKPGRGGQIARSAGASAQVLGKEGKYVLVRLRSGEVRMILSTCRATVGQVGNINTNLLTLVKPDVLVGRYSSTVRGSVMNLTITHTVVVKDALLSAVHLNVTLG